MTWYYKLWVDAIQFENSKHGDFRNWKFYVMTGITFSQGLNLATVLFWMSTWVKTRLFIPIDLFPSEIINGAISGFITLFLPFLVINYFLIFRNKKYKLLLKKYQYKRGKLYITYFVISLSIFIVPLLIAFFINRLV